jgi:flagellar assembly protein FliH
MSAPAKFLFDVDFSGREKQAETTVNKAALEVAQAEAEARGYRTGYAAAQAEVAAESARRLAATMERIVTTLAALAGGLETIERRLEAEAVDVAVAVASKLAPELVAREPFAEIGALAAECFNHLMAAPHVVVRVNDQLYAEARERLEEIARMRGFEGQLVVLAEPHIPVGTAGSSGPTAASCATARRSKPRSPRRWRVTSRCAAIPKHKVVWRD